MSAAPQNPAFTPVEGDYVIKDFRFASGESLPDLRLHYATFGRPERDARGVVKNAVLILHGTGGSGRQFLRTQAFCKKLREHDLLEPMQAEFTLGTGQKMALSGFLVVSRKKLKALSGEVLSELVKNDALELIFLHLQSMRNFWAVKDKLALVESANATAPAAEPAAADATQTEPSTKKAKRVRAE